MLHLRRFSLQIAPFALGVLLLLAATACGSVAAPTPLPTPTPTPTPTLPPPAINLPADEGPHPGQPIEWWYFNGHLADAQGTPYHFHLAAFVVRPPGQNATIRLFQAGLADPRRGVFATGEDSGSASAVEEPPGQFDLTVGDYRAKGDGQRYELGMTAGDYTLTLEAQSQKPAMLHQRDGLVDLGRAGTTYYYTRPRLAATGTLTVNGQGLPVTGSLWLDRQWGPFSPLDIGWDWGSLQFDDGSDLMFSFVFDAVSHESIIGYGSYSAPDGSTRHLSAAELALTPNGLWTSPETNVTYPMGWQLTATPLGLSVDLRPIMESSEVVSERNAPTYWEGAVSIAGFKGAAKAIGGQGFVELLGYAPPPEPPAATPTP